MTPTVSTRPTGSGALLKLPFLARVLVLIVLLPAMLLFADTSDNQRSGLDTVRAQCASVQNATRVAASYGNNGVQTVSDQFQLLRQAYSDFTRTLTPEQQNRYGNEWAELASGLDVIQEAFSNYQDDVANGRSPITALSDMCRVLNEAGRLWLQQFNSVASKAHVGW